MSGDLHLHFEPVMYVVRGFNHPKGYELLHAHELVLSVFMLGGGRARVFGAHGELTRSTMRDLADKLETMGIHTILVDRHGVEQEWKTGKALGRLYVKGKV